MARFSRLPTAAVVLSTIALLAACSSDNGSQPAGPDAGGGAIQAEGIPTFAKNAKGYADINVDDLATMMQDKSFWLVNVHVPYEGELPETDDFVQFDTVAGQLDRFPSDKTAPIVVYCRSGRMSDEAAEVLADSGYSNVMELDGGFRAWEAGGLPFIQDGG